MSEKLKMNQMNGESKDLHQENITRLKELFPEIVREGKVDFDVLRSLLGDDIQLNDNDYSFTWHGKERGRAYARVPSMGTLRPCVKESLGKDGTPGKFDSENLYIEGDNLEVLKLLQGSYHNAIKMIYIDPPYNTGKDFVYCDDYRNSIANYKAMTGQTDASGAAVRANPETSGRYHTDWLNMMYPRLILARELLKNEGVIFISIDDTELANLRKMCDDVFGEENFVGEIIWQTATDNNASQISIEHEYILCFAKNKDLQDAWEKPSTKIKAIINKYDELRRLYGIQNDMICKKLRKWINDVNRTHEVDLGGVSHYSYVDDKGVFYPGNSANTKPGGYTFDIIHPIDKQVCAKPENGYRWPLSTLMEADKNGNVLWGKDHTSIPKIKKRAETATELLKSIYYEDNRASTEEFVQLMDGKVFDNPKSPLLIAMMMSFVLFDNDLVLDCFAGSSTTAQAMLEECIRRNIKLNYILVQLPELTYEIKDGKEIAKKECKIAFQKGYRNICEIGKERIRRVVTKKIKVEHPEFTGDMGFRVFKLDTSNIVPWNPNPEELREKLFAARNNVLLDRTTEDLLYEILLKRNLPLTLPIDEKKVPEEKDKENTMPIDEKKVTIEKGKINTIYVVGGGAMAICLDEKIHQGIAEEIVKLRDEYAPVIPMTVVFRDTGLDDVTKTNAMQILLQAGFEAKAIMTI